ncbi:MAG: aminopeptidase P family N-terminal domain-containing protein, partial [Muribaculaceae bacterium]|nr:aminopeptidase P family N-terminal domain-containing protein [Muribaculaceae bacterium]
MNSIVTGRLEAMRAAMRAASVSATIIPHTDPHQSEYLAEHWQVRQWLSGFTGSAGTLVITSDKALLWTDSRYFLQGAQQLEGTGIELMKEGLPETPSIEDWLCANLPADSVVGVDGMVFSLTAVNMLCARLRNAGLSLDTTFAPIDSLWTSRPALPDDSVFVHDVKYAGENAADKIARILAKAATHGDNAMFISALDEIAW